MNNDAPNSLHKKFQKRSLGLIMGFLMGLSCLEANAQLAVDLGAAAPFSVLAGSGITVAASGTTTIGGDIGSFPTPAITGLENVILLGVNHAGDSVTQNAKGGLFAAYNDAAGRSAPLPEAGLFDLGGFTLLGGVYQTNVAYELTGTLTLDGGGNSNSVWIFQSASTLTTASNSVVNLINGAQASNIFWQIGSSATLGTNSTFAGSILASESITLTNGADIEGGLYALNGAVTLDNNNITPVPEPGSAVLFGFGMALLLFKRRRMRP